MPKPIKKRKSAKLLYRILYMYSATTIATAAIVFFSFRLPLHLLLPTLGGSAVGSALVFYAQYMYSASKFEISAILFFNYLPPIKLLLLILGTSAMINILGFYSVAIYTLGFCAMFFLYKYVYATINLGIRLPSFCTRASYERARNLLPPPELADNPEAKMSYKKHDDITNMVHDGVSARADLGFGTTFLFTKNHPPHYYYNNGSSTTAANQVVVYNHTELQACIQINPAYTADAIEQCKTSQFFGPRPAYLMLDTQGKFFSYGSITMPQELTALKGSAIFKHTVNGEPGTYIVAEKDVYKISSAWKPYEWFNFGPNCGKVELVLTHIGALNNTVKNAYDIQYNIYRRKSTLLLLDNGQLWWINPASGILEAEPTFNQQQFGAIQYSHFGKLLILETPNAYIPYRLDTTRQDFSNSIEFPTIERKEGDKLFCLGLRAEYLEQPHLSQALLYNPNTSTLKYIIIEETPEEDDALDMEAVNIIDKVEILDRNLQKIPLEEYTLIRYPCKNTPIALVHKNTGQVLRIHNNGRNSFAYDNASKTMQMMTNIIIERPQAMHP